MSFYIALFRGINVGGKNVIPMKELADIFLDNGYEKVQTYIQSGNVVFQSRKKVDQLTLNEIGKKILKKKGFEPRIFILSESEWRKSILNNPFPIKQGTDLHFFFLESPSNAPDTQLMQSLKSPTEQFKLIHKVFYLHAPEGIGRSKLAARVEKALRVPVTARNWNTIHQINLLITPSPHTTE